ncbi:MAG TPA: hypothetical protein VK824_09010 [Planctomycetota bacterium]|nr:hypothetical protein [Planctomycetota bacterium]
MSALRTLDHDGRFAREHGGAVVSVLAHELPRLATDEERRRWMAKLHKPEELVERTLRAEASLLFRFLHAAGDEPQRAAFTLYLRGAMAGRADAAAFEKQFAPAGAERFDAAFVAYVKAQCAAELADGRGAQTPSAPPAGSPPVALEPAATREAFLDALGQALAHEPLFSAAPFERSQAHAPAAVFVQKRPMVDEAFVADIAAAHGPWIAALEQRFRDDLQAPLELKARLDGGACALVVLASRSLFQQYIDVCHETGPNASLARYDPALRAVVTFDDWSDPGPDGRHQRAEMHEMAHALQRSHSSTGELPAALWLREGWAESLAACAPLAEGESPTAADESPTAAALAAFDLPALKVLDACARTAARGGPRLLLAPGELIDMQEQANLIGRARDARQPATAMDGVVLAESSLFFRFLLVEDEVSRAPFLRYLRAALDGDGSRAAFEQQFPPGALGERFEDYLQAQASSLLATPTLDRAAFAKAADTAPAAGYVDDTAASAEQVADASMNAPGGTSGAASDAAHDGAGDASHDSADGASHDGAADEGSGAAADGEASAGAAGSASPSAWALGPEDGAAFAALALYVASHGDIAGGMARLEQVPAGSRPQAADELDQLRQLQALRRRWFEGLVGKPCPPVLRSEGAVVRGDISAVKGDTVTVRDRAGRLVEASLTGITAGDMVRQLGIDKSAPPEGEDAVRAFAWLLADDAGLHGKTEAELRKHSGPAGLPWIDRRRDYEPLLAMGEAAARLEELGRQPGMPEKKAAREAMLKQIGNLLTVFGREPIVIAHADALRSLAEPGLIARFDESPDALRDALGLNGFITVPESRPAVAEGESVLSGELQFESDYLHDRRLLSDFEDEPEAFTKSARKIATDLDHIPDWKVRVNDHAMVLRGEHWQRSKLVFAGSREVRYEYLVQCDVPGKQFRTEAVLLLGCEVGGGLLLAADAKGAIGSYPVAPGFAMETVENMDFVGRKYDKTRKASVVFDGGRVQATLDGKRAGSMEGVSLPPGRVAIFSHSGDRILLKNLQIRGVLDQDWLAEQRTAWVAAQLAAWVPAAAPGKSASGKK